MSVLSKNLLVCSRLCLVQFKNQPRCVCTVHQWKCVYSCFQIWLSDYNTDLTHKNTVSPQQKVADVHSGGNRSTSKFWDLPVFHPSVFSAASRCCRWLCWGWMELIPADCGQRQLTNTHSPLLTMGCFWGTTNFLSGENRTERGSNRLTLSWQH